MMDTLATPFEIKSIADSGTIEGLASAFGNEDSHGEIIAAGAFRKSLDRAGAFPMLLHHDLKRPIGIWTDLVERGDGLYAKGKIVVDTQDGREAHALAKAGALRGLSIGYLVRPGGAFRDQKSGLRTLTDIDLKETSLVTIGSNPKALVHTVKSIASVDDLRDLLREECGLSARRAKVAAGAAWKAINEAEDDDAVPPELAALFKQSAARIAGK